MAAGLVKNINSWVFLDVETGGFEPQKHGVTQVAMVAIKGENFEKIDLLNTYIKPYGDFIYDPEALKYTGITTQDLENGMDVKDVVNEIIQLLTKADLSPRNKGSKPIMVAYNSGFDKSFILQLFHHTKKIKELEKLVYGREDYFGNWQPEFLDAIFLPKAAFGHDPDMPNFKLGTCIEKTGIELADAHNAIQDTLAMKDMMVKFFQKLRSEGGEAVEAVEVSNIRKHWQF